MHAQVFKEKTLKTVETVRPVSAAGGHWRISQLGFGELNTASIENVITESFLLFPVAMF
jgi:hypothetical protein